MVVFNTAGIEKKDPEKLAGGWGTAHLSLGIMMVILGVSDYMTNPFGFGATDPAVLTLTNQISGYTGIALAFYGFFWIFLGASLVRGLDLRPVGQVAIAYAIVDLWLLRGAWEINQTFPGHPFYSLIILLVVLTVVFIVFYAAVHGRAGLLKVNAALLVILALLGFYIGFGLIYPTYTIW
jgi:uncharacterized membrane protein